MDLTASDEEITMVKFTIEKAPESLPIIEEETVEEMIVLEGVDYPVIEVVEEVEVVEEEPDEVAFVEEESIAMEPEDQGHGPFEIEPSSDTEGPFLIEPSSDHEGPFVITVEGEEIEEITEIHIASLPEESVPEEPAVETPIEPTSSPNEAPEFSISDWFKPLFDFSDPEEEVEVEEIMIITEHPSTIQSVEPEPEVRPLILGPPEEIEETQRLRFHLRRRFL